MLVLKVQDQSEAHTPPSDDDNVEEYDFSNETEDEEEEDDGLDTAHYKFANGALPVDDSSDREKDEKAEDVLKYAARPWRQPGYDIEARRAKEEAYVSGPVNAVRGDWRITEDYVRETDREMTRYVQDYPLEKWVIGLKRAQGAYDNLVERNKWRNLGIRIFGGMDQRPPPAPPGMMAVPHPHGAPMHPAPLHPVPMNTMPMRGMPPPSNRHPSQQHHPAPMNPQAAMHQQAPRGMQQLAQQHVLPSQPNGRHPQQQVYPIPAVPGPAPPPPQPAPRRQPPPAQNGERSRASTTKGKEKVVEEPKPPPVDDVPATHQLPPYPMRQKPAGRRVNNKSGRRYTRAQAEAEVYPWARQIDFPAERAKASWDDSIYDQETLRDMAKIRALNKETIRKYEKDEIEVLPAPTTTRRHSSNAADEDDDDSDKMDTNSSPSQRKTRDILLTEAMRNDCYAYASIEDQQKAESLGYKHPEDIMNAYEAGKVELDVCAGIKICWNPYKKGLTQNLEQAKFSIKDTILTNQQLDRKLILTRRAGECLMDFCPHLLFKETLLRVHTEAGLSNKSMRDRISQNGNYIDSSTMTKRIGSALGQKQQQAASRTSKKALAEQSDPAKAKKRGYSKGEDTYYNANVYDSDFYTLYFGNTPSNRKLVNVGGRRAAKRRKPAAEDDDDVIEVAGSSRRKKRAKSVEEDGEEVTSAEEILTSEVTTPASDEVEEDDEEEAEEEVEENLDAVSVQSDTMLDEIED